MEIVLPNKTLPSVQYAAVSTADSAMGSSVNTTSATVLGEAGSMPVYVQAISIILYSTITVVAIGGNITVCYIVLAYQRMRTVTNYFIVNLACGDILMSVLCVPFTFVANVITGYWPFGRLMCPLVTYAQVVAVFLSAFTLLAISIDRFVAVIYPLRPRITTRQTAIVIGLIWLLSLAVPLPVAILSKVTREPDMYGHLRNICVEAWPDNKQRYVFSLVIMVLQYFLPLFVLLFTYTWIAIVIWVKTPPGEAEDTRDQRMAASKRKMVKMMITVVIIYALCWLPLHTITLIGDSHPTVYDFEHIQVVWAACHWLAMSNCCYNPMVYCWMNSRFRNGFRYVLRFCPCVKYDAHVHAPRRPLGVCTFHTSIKATPTVVNVTNKRTYGVYSTTVLNQSNVLPSRTNRKASDSGEEVPLKQHSYNGYNSRVHRDNNSSPWSTP